MELRSLDRFRFSVGGIPLGVELTPPDISGSIKPDYTLESYPLRVRSREVLTSLQNRDDFKTVTKSLDL